MWGTMKSQFKWYEYVLGLGAFMSASLPVMFVVVYSQAHPGELPTWIAAAFLIWTYSGAIWFYNMVKEDSYNAGLEAGNRGVPLENSRNATQDERDKHNRARESFGLPPIPDNQPIIMRYDSTLRRWMGPTIGDR